MQIQAHNSDEWLDDYLMGRLPEAEEQRAEEVLFEHPHLAANLEFRQEVIHRAAVDGERIFAREIQARRPKAAAVSWREQFAALFRRPALIGGLAMAVVLAFVVVRLADDPGNNQMAMEHAAKNETPGEMSGPSLERIPQAQAAPSQSFSEVQDSVATDSDKSEMNDDGRPGPEDQLADGTGLVERRDISARANGAYAERAEATFDGFGADDDFNVYAAEAPAEIEESNAPAEAMQEVNDVKVADRAPITADVTQFQFDRNSPRSDSMPNIVIAHEAITVDGPVAQESAVRSADAEAEYGGAGVNIAQMRFGDSSDADKKTVDRKSAPQKQAETDAIALTRSQIDDEMLRSRAAFNSIGRMTLPAPEDTLRSFPPLFEWTERQPSGSYLIIENSSRKEVARFRLEDDARSFKAEGLRLEAGTYEWYLIGEKYLSYRSRFHVASDLKK